MATWERTLNCTEPEEAVLVKMATYFIDMGWFWHFNGIPRDFQDGFIKQLWEKVKKNYE